YSSVFFFSSRRRHTRFSRDWSSDVCSSDLQDIGVGNLGPGHLPARHANQLAQRLKGRQPRHIFVSDDLHGVELPLVGRKRGAWRSEERRVGKECRSRGAAYEYKKTAERGAA